MNQTVRVVGCALLASVGSAVAADGVWTAGPGSWTNTALWADGALPGAGGTAAFVGSGGGTVTVPSGFPFTLSALYFNTNNVAVSWTLQGETNALIAPAVVRVDNQNLFLKAALAGSDGLQKTGAGTLVLANPNPLLSGSIKLLGGRLLLQADEDLGQVPAAYQSDALVLDGAGFGNNDPTLTLAETRGVTLGTGGGYLFGRNDFRTVMASPITGSGNLYVNKQTGYVVLSNTNNTYSGDTVLGASGPGYSSNAPIAMLILGANEVLPDGAGAGGLVIDGAQKGVLDLNGKTETVNRLSGTAGAAIRNGASSEGLLRAGLDNTDTSYSGVVQAGVTLEKIGLGTLTYSNAAVSAGLVKVTEGALLASTPAAISQTAVQLNGATLKTPVQAAGQRFTGPLLLSRNSTLDRSEAAASFVWSGPLLATNATGVPVLEVAGGSGPFAVGSTNRSCVFGIDASVAGGVSFQNRVWLETLPTSCAWSIAAGADVAIGTPGLLGTGDCSLSSYSVRLPSAVALGAGGETVTVGGSGLAVWFDATSETDGRLVDDPSYAFTAANPVILSGTAAQAGFDGAGTVNYAGQISGSGTLVKNGSGDAVLQSANSFAGSVQVNAGRLLFSDVGQLGDSGNAVTLAGGYLRYTGGSPLTFTRALSATAGGLDVSGAAVELSGATTGALTKRGSGTLTLSGATPNSLLDLYVAEGVALLSKSGAAAVRSITGVASGAVVRLEGSGGNLVSSNVVLSGGALDLNGRSESVGVFSSTSFTSVVRSSGGPATLTLGEGHAAGAYYGSFGDASLTVTKSGTNQCTVSGAAGTQAAGAMNVAAGTWVWGPGVRSVRVRPGPTRSGGTTPAIGELQLTLRGRPVAWPSTASTVASSALSTNNSWLVNDNNSRSYWQADALPAYIGVDAKTALLCDGYRLFTSNAGSDSDPLSWTVEVSPDNVVWVTADVRTNQTVTTSRGALFGEYTFNGAWPCDAAGDATVADIASNATLRVAVPSEAVSALTGSGTLVLSGGATLRAGSLSGFSGNVSGNGQLLLSGDAPLRVASAGESVTAANGSALPAAVTVGANNEPLFGGALADGLATLGLTKRGSGALSVVDAGSTYSGDTRVETGTLVVQAPMYRFRYIRFNPTLTVNNNVPNSGFALCISEFQLTSNGVTVAYPAGSTNWTPYANHNSSISMKAIDGIVSGSATSNQRWLSSVIPNPLTIDTKTGVTFNGYRIYESSVNGSDNGRAPTAWTVEGSHDGTNWLSLCSESGVTVPPYVQDVGQLIGNFSAGPARFKLPFEFYGETNAAALKLAAVTARYLRFTVTDARYTSEDFGNSGFQLSELQLMRNGSPLLYPAGTVARAPADGYNDGNGRYFPPAQAVDNALPVPGTDTNRWYSFAMVNPLTVDMGQPVCFDAYRWYTGPNGMGRDPLGWKMEISNNSTNWYTVDVQTNQAITSSRNAVAGTWLLNLPAAQYAANAIPDRSRTYVAAGATLRIDARGETVGPLSGTGTVALASATAFGINGFENASYAGGITGTGTVTKSGAAAQSLTGALTFSGSLVVESGVLDLQGAALAGVTNITLRSGGELTGAAAVSGSLTVTFEGGIYNATLAVSGALTTVGTVRLKVPEGAALPYRKTLFTFASASTATRAALEAAIGTVTVPHGCIGVVRTTAAEASLSLSTAGTVLNLR